MAARKGEGRPRPGRARDATVLRTEDPSGRPVEGGQGSRAKGDLGGVPLYRPLHGAPWLKKAPANANLALWHEKFFHCWTIDQKTCSVGAPQKVSWLEGVVAAAQANHAQLKSHLDDRRARTEALVSAKGGWLGRFKAVDRMVSGTGRSHPVENGFAFHHLLGVPYLPGSSLKGLVRAWAEEHQPDEIAELFGAEGQVGAVDLLDALPEAPPPLVVEVLTPHYGGWTTDDPPGDWRSPVPIPFLAVEAGATFLVGIVARRASDRRRVSEVRDLLIEALRCEGAGARTTLGFGRWELDLCNPASQGAPDCGRTAAGPATEGAVGVWLAALEGKGDQEVYERTRAALEGPAEQETLEALAVALESLGYLQAWRAGRKRGGETTGPKKLQALTARLDQLRVGGADVSLG